MNRPTPTHLRVLNGNPSGRPLPENEPQPEGDLSAPPVHLTDLQRREWNYMIDKSPLGLLKHLDRDYLEAYVVAVCDVREADAKIRETGPVFFDEGDSVTTTRPDGTVVTKKTAGRWKNSPWVLFRERAFQRMVKAGGDLGFNPVSRTRLGTPKDPTKPKQANRFAANAAKKGT